MDTKQTSTTDDRPPAAVVHPEVPGEEYVRAELAMQLMEQAFALGVAACRSEELAKARESLRAEAMSRRPQRETLPNRSSYDN